MPALAALVLGSALSAGPSEPMELGPPPTRELFPLFLISLAYQPVDPTPLGRGRWQVELSHT